MYLCYGRVDGLRVRYWYIPGFGANTGCSDGKDVYDSKNDLVELCRHMLREHNVEKELWVAYVSFNLIGGGLNDGVGGGV